uniref:Uncharacterized protein n=1 Tax=Lepeophtheirus salmonis TaxID=72036 RepID=A0A0K2V990_LEPSM
MYNLYKNATCTQFIHIYLLNLDTLLKCPIFKQYFRKCMHFSPLMIFVSTVRAIISLGFFSF